LFSPNPKLLNRQDGRALIGNNRPERHGPNRCVPVRIQEIDSIVLGGPTVAHWRSNVSQIRARYPCRDKQQAPSKIIGACCFLIQCLFVSNRAFHFGHHLRCDLANPMLFGVLHGILEQFFFGLSPNDMGASGRRVVRLKLSTRIVTLERARDRDAVALGGS
jgi:hypothetical protein